MTTTQKVTSAHYEYIKGLNTLDETATAWAISRRALANCNYIAKHHPEYIEPLFNGNSIVLFDTTKNKEITTNRISTIAKIVKAEQDMKVRVVLPEEFEKKEYHIDAQLKYEQHKQYFYQKVAEFERPETDSSYLYQITLKELLNVKQELEELKNAK